MKLPNPKTVLGRAVERFILIAVSAGATDLAVHSSATFKAGAAYLVLKTLLDLVNKQIPNL